MLNGIKSSAVLLLMGMALSACRKDPPVIANAANNGIIETAPNYQKPVNVYINRYISGYYEALPNHYQLTTKNYPLLVFLHGGGQTGNGDADLPLVLNDGVAKLISERKLPGNFSINGENFSFIILSPQFRGAPPDSMAWSFIEYALKKYRIDSTRIYITGLSMGGVLTTGLAGLYTAKIAAAAPVAGESFGDNREENARHIAMGKLPLWAFHNADDPSIPSYVASEFINLVNSYQPVIPPKLTLFNAFGHDAWTKALDPLYKENNMNVYEWMLQYKR